MSTIATWPSSSKAEDIFWEMLAFCGPKVRLTESRTRMRSLIEEGRCAEAWFLAVMCDWLREGQERAERGDPCPEPRWIHDGRGPRYGPPNKEVPMFGHPAYVPPAHQNKPAANWREEA